MVTEDAYSTEKGKLEFNGIEPESQLNVTHRYHIEISLHFHAVHMKGLYFSYSTGLAQHVSLLSRLGSCNFIRKGFREGEMQ